MSIVSRALVVGITACALLLAGCGGGASGPTRDPGDVEVLRGTTPQTMSAGTAPTYRPTGRLIADSGFRPERDGFAFENYSTVPGVPELTPAYVEALFGPQVCASGTGATCRLTPPARAWLEVENEAMAAGHCFGLSVASSLLYTRTLHPDRFGAATTAALRLSGNAPLRQTIAQLNAIQELPAVRKAAIAGTPNEVLDRLVTLLRAGGPLPTLGLFHPQSGGGHAVTPYAVEDRGDGRFAVLVYDNNHPRITRAVSFDRHADAWRFEAQTNATDRRRLYGGDRRAGNLALFPTPTRTAHFPCPFCAAARARAGGGFNEIALEGDPANHARLLLTDARGRHTGRVGRRLVNRIPGVRIERRVANQDWREGAEPVYLVPTSVSVSATVDGGGLTGPVVERLVMIGPGDDTAVEGIALRRGERVLIGLAGDASRVSVRTDPRHGESPVLRIGHADRGASYDVALRAHRLPGGATLSLAIDRARHEVTVAARGARAGGAYRLRVDRTAQGRTTTRSAALAVPPDGAVHRHALGR